MVDGGLTRSTQHFILNAKDGVYANEAKESSRIHGGGENGAVGSLAARGVAEFDWASVWQALVVCLCPAGAARRDPSCATTPLEVGVDALGARGDIQRHGGAGIDTIDGCVTGPVGLDGEPGSPPSWRIGSVSSGPGR